MFTPLDVNFFKYWKVRNSPTCPFAVFELHGTHDTQFKWILEDSTSSINSLHYASQINIEPTSHGDWERVNRLLEETGATDDTIRKIRREIGLSEQLSFPKGNNLKLYENSWEKSGSLSLSVKEGYKIKVSIYCSEIDFFNGSPPMNHPQLSDFKFAGNRVNQFTVEMTSHDHLFIDVDRDYFDQSGFRLELGSPSLGATELKRVLISGNLDCEVDLELVSGFGPPIASQPLKDDVTKHHSIESTTYYQEPRVQLYKTLQIGTRDEYVKTIQRHLRDQGLYIHEISEHYTQETANAVNQWIAIVNAETSHTFAADGRWTPELDEATRVDMPALPVVVPGSSLSLQDYCNNSSTTFNPYQKLSLNGTLQSTYDFLDNTNKAFLTTYSDVDPGALAIKDGASLNFKIKTGYVVKFIINSDKFDFNDELMPSELNLTEQHEEVGSVYQIHITLHGGDSLYASNQVFTFRKGNHVVRKTVSDSGSIFFIHQKKIEGPTGKFGGYRSGIEGSFGKPPQTTTWDDFVKELGYKYHITKIGRTERGLGSSYIMKIQGNVAAEAKVEGAAEIKVENLGSNSFKITKHVTFGAGVEAGSTRVALKAGLNVNVGVQASAMANVSFKEIYIAEGIDHTYEIFEYLLYGYNDNMLLILLDEFGLIDGINSYLSNHPNDTRREGYEISFSKKGTGSAHIGAGFNIGTVGGGVMAGVTGSIEKSQNFSLGLPRTDYPNGYIGFGSQSKFDLSMRFSAGLGLGLSPPTNQDFQITSPDANEKSSALKGGIDIPVTGGFSIEANQKISLNTVITDEYFHTFADELYSDNLTPDWKNKYTEVTTDISRTFRIPFTIPTLGSYEVSITFTSSISVANDFISKIQSTIGGGIYNALDTILSNINIDVKFNRCFESGQKQLGFDIKYLGIGLGIEYSSYRKEIKEIYSWSGTASDGAMVIYDFIVNLLNNKASIEPRESSNFLHGIEISHYQEKIDYSLIPDTVDFVYIKASQGVLYSDPHLAANTAGCLGHSLTHGFYHFATPSVNKYGDLDCHKEASWFANVLKKNINAFSKLPPVLVLRINKEELTPIQMQLWISGFLTTLNNELTQEINSETIDENFILYTTPKFIKRYFSDSSAHSLDTYSLWLGNEEKVLEGFDPTLYGFSSPLIWQHDQGGRVSGINTDVRKSRASQQFWS